MYLFGKSKLSDLIYKMLFLIFIVIGADGQETYSEHGQQLKEFVIDVLNEAIVIIRLFKDAFLAQKGGFEDFTKLLKMATYPLKVLLKRLL